jgi:hypothetical protein
MTPAEALFLDKAYEDAYHDESEPDVRNVFPVKNGNDNIGPINGRLLKSAHTLVIENLERLRLVVRHNVPISINANDPFQNSFPQPTLIYVSNLGLAFVRACRLPKR